MPQSRLRIGTSAAIRIACALIASSTLANSAELAAPSWLHANLSFMPFSLYDNAHHANYENLFTGSCPNSSTTYIEQCFKNYILPNMAAQGVSGVRIHVTLCSTSDQNQALTGCGNPWTGVSFNPTSGTGLTWITNVGNFFNDVKTAGIPNVSIIFGSDSSIYTTVAKAQTTSPNGSYCSDTPDPVYFRTFEPYGLEPSCSPPGPNCNPTPGNPVGNWWGGGTTPNAGYNCAPINNKNFIGWNNMFSVIDAVLGKAQGVVDVSELEIADELDMQFFTVHLRNIADNSSPQSAGLQAGQKVNVRASLQALMTKHTFSSGSLTNSAVWMDSTLAELLYDCSNVYADYARNGGLDSVAQAFGGGIIGVSKTATVNANTGYLVCGGTPDSTMITSPFYSGQPTVVDAHLYPAIGDNGATDTQIQQVAAHDYSDIVHFLVAAGYSTTKPGNATVMIGETYPGKLDSLNLGTTLNPNWCWSGPWNLPSSAPTDNAAGFNQSSLAGYTFILRPWIELEDGSGLCFPYGGGPGSSNGYQDVNYNNGGPYTPSNR